MVDCQKCRRDFQYLNKLITNPSYNKILRICSISSRKSDGKLAVRLGLKGQEAIKGTVTQALNITRRRSTQMAAAVRQQPDF